MIGSNADYDITTLELVNSRVDIQMLTVYSKEKAERVAFGFQSCDENIIDYVENLLIKEGVCLIKKMWQSAYNNYVVYDRRPFGAGDGGFITRLLLAPDTERFPWLCHLITEHYKKVDELERMYANAT